MPWPTHILAAGGFVFDKQGNVLIVKTHHRGWDCPGGQVENGENLEEGLLREIMEESGIRATVRCLVGLYSNVGSHVAYDGITHVPTKLMADFLCDFIDGTPTPSDETSVVLWVPREQALSYITFPPMKLRFEQALQFDGRVRYCSYLTQPEFVVLSDRYL